jgi:serine O-acetyltransferase
MSSALKADIARYSSEGLKGYALPALWTLVWHRFGHWLYHGNCPLLLRILLKPIYIPGCVFIETFLQTTLPASAKIGPGLFMAHVGGIHIHPHAIVGSNCDIAHHVTIGVSGLGRPGAPVLGDNVFVGTGAVVIGKITVGDGAKVGANSVVTTNVPPGVTVVGVPAQIVVEASSPTPKSME